MADRTKPCTCMCRIIIRFGGKSRAAMSCLMYREHLATLLLHRVCRLRNYSCSIDCSVVPTSDLLSLIRFSSAVFFLLFSSFFFFFFFSFSIFSFLFFFFFLLSFFFFFFF